MSQTHKKVCPVDASGTQSAGSLLKCLVHSARTQTARQMAEPPVHRDDAERLLSEAAAGRAARSTSRKALAGRPLGSCRRGRRTRAGRRWCQNTDRRSPFAVRPRTTTPPARRWLK